MVTQFDALAAQLEATVQGRKKQVAALTALMEHKAISVDTAYQVVRDLVIADHAKTELLAEIAPQIAPPQAQS